MSHIYNVMIAMLFMFGTKKIVSVGYVRKKLIAVIKILLYIVNHHLKIANETDTKEDVKIALFICQLYDKYKDDKGLEDIYKNINETMSKKIVPVEDYMK